MNGDPQQRFNRRGHEAHRPARPPASAEDADQTPRGELWGLCDLCDRWYFVAFEPGLEVRSPRCPVCASVAARLSLRVGSG
jgi:hypothetical protein